MIKSLISTLALASIVIASPTTFDPNQANARAVASNAAMQAFLDDALASNATFLQKRDPNGCINTFHSFLSNNANPGYDNLIGMQGPGPNGWRLYSPTSNIEDPNTESRLRYDFSFNDGSAPFTNIWVSMRGAPDSGKNSNAVLREPYCIIGPLDGNGNHIHDCDEIDIVEIYGGGNNDAEFTYYTGSGSYTPGIGPILHNHGTYTSTQNGAAGKDFYTYKVYLERGQFIKFIIALSNGFEIGNAVFTDGVPTKPMNLFAGEYNCAASGGDTVGYCGKPFTGGNSFMEIAFIYYKTCQTSNSVVVNQSGQ